MFPKKYLCFCMFQTSPLPFQTPPFSRTCEIINNICHRFIINESFQKLENIIPGLLADQKPWSVRHSPQFAVVLTGLWNSRKGRAGTYRGQRGGAALTSAGWISIDFCHI